MRQELGNHLYKDKENQGYLVQVPGMNSAEELLELIGKTAKLTFHEVLDEINNKNYKIELGQIMVPNEKMRYFLYFKGVICGFG